MLVPGTARRFTTNFIRCIALSIRNRSGYKFFGSRFSKAPMPSNSFFSASRPGRPGISGSLCTTGENQMGAFKFSCRTLPGASIITFSSLWGIALHEWRGAGARTKSWLTVSLAVLLLSTIVVGYGNYLGTLPH